MLRGNDTNLVGVLTLRIDKFPETIQEIPREPQTGRLYLEGSLSGEGSAMDGRHHVVFTGRKAVEAWAFLMAKRQLTPPEERDPDQPVHMVVIIRGFLWSGNSAQVVNVDRVTFIADDTRVKQLAVRIIGRALEDVSAGKYTL